jgi:hypothetical protein
MLRTAAALVFLTMVSVPAHAGQSLDSARDTDSPVTHAETPGTVRLNVSVVPEAPPRPGALPVLYISYAALQAFDGYQTIQGVAGGGREVNPLMTGIAGSPAAVWTIKAVSAVVAIGAAERLWKTNKAGAIAVMLIANGVSVAVAAHNVSVLRQLR